MHKTHNTISVYGSRRFGRYLALLIGVVPFSSMAAPLDFGVKAGFEHFQWKEIDADGAKYLDETGTRYAVSGFLGNTLKAKKDFIYRAEAKLYFGAVDYDGQTQDGVPAQSTTRYGGSMAEGEAGYRAGNADGTFAWDVIGRAGFDFWRREIDNTVDVTGRSVRGATEQYTMFNLRVGTGPYWQSGRWQARFIAGFKLPIATNEFISKGDSGFDDDVTLKPKGRTSLFWNFYNHIRVTDKLLITLDAFYDSYRFDASNPVVVTDNGDTFQVLQPKSSQDNYGLLGGVSFSF